MQRTDFSQANCPVARILDLVGEWWSLLVIREALLGVARCDGFQRRLGISCMIKAATGHPVARLEATSSDGRRLGLAELGLAFDLGRADLA